MLNRERKELDAGAGNGNDAWRDWVAARNAALLSLLSAERFRAPEALPDAA